MFLSRDKSTLVTPERALRGRDEPIAVPASHHVLGNPLRPPYPEGFEVAVFGLGCFWGAERIFWQTPGVWSTAAGYAGGYTPNPTYEEVCSGRTAHTEVVQVVYDPAVVTYRDLLKIFWEAHDPTQGMAQGNDAGTQYRSAIYASTPDQLTAAQQTASAFAPVLRDGGYGAITTEIAPAGEFFFAEDYHQQYLAKNPRGYCGIGGTGMSCPVGVASAE